ncbi:MAG: ABC transporter substrate-binding protein [Oscillospiraceae bacterium]|nr:ABC transporter substrate-binding protein [Oscillospiraceae bacterium]
MKKTLAFLLAIFLMVSLFAACGKTESTEPDAPAVTETETPAEEAPEAEAPAEEEAPEAEAPVEEATEPEETVEPATIRLGGLKGPTSMGMVKLLEDAEAGETFNTYEFTMAAAADELTPLLLKGELDVLAVPANLGSVLYNNSEGAVQMLAVNTLGVIYIVEKGGETVTDMASLKGKTIYATGKGSTPEYALAYLLSEYGLDMETDVTVEWKSEPSEVVAQMAAMDNAVAMLPQPFVTVAGNQLEGLRIALSLTEVWDALDNGSQFITGGLIVRTAFAEEHPDALAKFLEEYIASTEYVNANPADAAVMIEKYDIVKAAIAEKALPYCNIVGIAGSEMKDMLEGYLQVLFDQNPKAVGGALPGDDFYWVNE